MQLSPEGLPRSEPQAEAAAPAAAPPPAQIDEYEIIRPVGRGATGQVYQALDTVLGRSVAVKVLASDKPSQNSFDRFLVEARAIARLQHPNVLAIHRVGVAHGRPYLVEEFLRGESLDQIPLPLAWPRVLNIAVQLARGLAAAHRQGVLHRDIKPANVMLLADGTAKLLDFGLAKLSDQLSPSGELHLVAQPSPGPGPLSPILRSPSSQPAIQSPPPESAVVQRIDSLSGLPRPAGELGVAQTLPEAAGSGTNPPLNSHSPSLTLAGSLLGTPAYMAPEAWRGEAAGARSDVYSFGALLYELCAGHPPHNFDQLEDISRAARETDVRPLSTLVPTVNRRLAGMIDRCLRREPGERYPTAELLQLELEGLAAELAVPTAQTVIKQALRRRWRLTALAALVLLASPILVIRQLMHPPASVQVGGGSRSQRQAVAILGLLDRGAGREHAGFAAALSDLLGAELAVGERLRRIPADSVARMQTELRLPLSEQYSPQQLARIRQNVDADLLLTGSYAAEGAGRLRISILVLDVQSGSQRALASVAGSPGELFGLVARTGRDLRRQLGLAELSSAQQAELRASRPANPQLAQLYAQGRERLRHFDAVGARPLLEQVATGDVDYPLGHLAMAEVWTQLGYEEKAKAEAKRAFELASNLPREDRHLIEAKYREATKDWDKAIALYRSLQTFFPDALDYGLALASAQQSGGDIAAAQTTLRQLRARLPRAGSDPRVDILQAKLTLDGGDPMAALALFDKATRQGEDNGAPLLIARARLEAAYALESTGQHDRALQYAKTAQDLFAGAGDRGAAADALMAMGAAYMFQGDFGRALATAEDALALLLEIQNSSLSAAHLCNMAQLLAKRGDLALARSRAEGGLLLARELGLKETIGGNYLIIGWISLLQGQPDQALRAYAQAEIIFNELADPRMIAWIQWHIGQTLFAKGDLEQSRKHHDEALAIREKHDLKGFAAESRAALAALAIEEGRAAEAETLALAAAEQFAEEQQADNEAWARTLLAEARVAQGKVAAGLRELERARQQSATTQNAVIGFLVRRKYLELTAGNPKNKVEISRALDSLLEETTKLGFLAEQLEIKLLKQRTVPAASLPVEPARMIQDVARQADAAGLGLIAIKANRLISERQN